MAAGDMADFMGSEPHDLLKPPADISSRLEKYYSSPRHGRVKGPIVDDMQTDIVLDQGRQPSEVAKHSLEWYV